MRLILILILVFCFTGCDTRDTLAPPMESTMERVGDPTADDSRVGDPTADDSRIVEMQGPLLPGQERPKIRVETGSE